MGSEMCIRDSSQAQFRPISRLPLVSKILEKIAVRHWFLPFINNIDASQFAYLPRCGSGTTSALTIMYNSILRYLDSKSGAIRLLALDFSKAFDRLPFQSIIQSSIFLKLPKQAIAWLMSYVNNRCQCVSVNDKYSSWRVLPSGVPQGSILGPLLFSITLASLEPLFNNSRMIKYADDITLLHFVRSAADDLLQRELDNLSLIHI